MEWKFRRVDRLTVHRLGEAEKQLRQVAFGPETDPRADRNTISSNDQVLSAVAHSPGTDRRHAAVALGSSAPALRRVAVAPGQLRLCFGVLLLPIPLPQKEKHQRLQGFTVIR